MCNSFKDTCRQLALTNTHARSAYIPAGESGYINSCSLLLVAVPQYCESIAKCEFEYYDFLSGYRSPQVFNKILQKP